MKRVFFLSLILLQACNFTPDSPKELLLFDGATLKGWHLYNAPSASSIWFVEDGLLTCDPAHDGTYGDLITDLAFEGDYTFSCEWKVGSGGNSGVFIHVLESQAYAAPWMSAVEYQILDHSDSTNHNYNDPKRMSGALYGFQDLPEELPYHQNGWNTTLIQVQGEVLTFFLNDVQTAKVDLASPAWKAQVKASKFAQYEGFGQSRKGAISLQAWKGRVQFRNLQITN